MDPTLTTGDLADEFGCGHSQISEILKAAGKKFRDINHLRRGLTSFFESQGSKFWRRGIDLLPEKWEKTTQADGAYFE